MKTNEENLMALQPKDPRRPIELTEDMNTAEKLEALQFNTDWLHKALINMAASNQGLFYSTRLRTTANLEILDSLTSKEVEDGESSETENEEKEETPGNKETKQLEGTASTGSGEDGNNDRERLEDVGIKTTSSDSNKQGMGADTSKESSTEAAKKVDTNGESEAGGINLTRKDEPVAAPVKEKEQQGLAAMMQKETSPSQKK